MNACSRRRTHRSFVLSVIALAVFLGCLPPVVSAQEQVVLEFMVHRWTAATIANIESAVERFEQLHPHIKVEINRTPSWDVFPVRVAAGAPPNVVTASTNQIGDWGLQGLLRPLEDIIEARDLRSKIFPELWGSVTNAVNGRIYGVPAVETGPRIGLIWNADLVDEAGLHIDPQGVLTWSEFLDAAERLTLVGDDGSVVRIGWDPENGQNTRSYTIAPSLGTYWLDPVSGEPNLASEEFIAALELITDRIYSRYPGWRGSASPWYRTARGSAAVENVGIYGPGQMKLQKPDIRMLVTWPPHNERLRVQQMLNWSLAIPAGATHVEEAAALIEFLATDVTLQMELIQSSGFLGGGIEFLEQLLPWAQQYEPEVAWYLLSMWTADVVDSVPAHPFTNRAVSLFNTAKINAFTMQQPARNALQEANRILRAEMVQAGLLQ